MQVLPSRQIVVEPLPVTDHPDRRRVTLLAGRRPVDQDFAPAGTQKPRNHPQYGGLSRSVAPQQSHNAAGRNVQAGVTHGRIFAEELPDTAQ